MQIEKSPSLAERPVPEFPGCRPITIRRDEITTHEGRFEFWDADRRPALKRQLVDQVVEAARELCRTGRFDQSLTLQAIRMCKDDPEWLSGYTGFVGGGIYERGNHLKQTINREIGRSVRAAVGAEVVTDGNGRTARVNVDGEIIQGYTPFASYDPAAVAER